MSEIRCGAGETANETWHYGCLFCRSGAENQIIGVLKTWYPGIEAVSAHRMRIRRGGGSVSKELAPVFPGYIFFRARGDVTMRKLLQAENVYRLLKDADGNWRLRGSDREIAERLLAAGGTIGFSKARYTDGRIQILDGFLKDYEENITRVNRRARTAEIRVTLGGKIFDIWLGFELMGE